MSMPELSPLIAANLVCHECGKRMEPRAVMANRGQKKVVAYLEYECVNEKTGCRYKVRSTDMTHAEMIPLRADGSEAKL